MEEDKYYEYTREEYFAPRDLAGKDIEPVTAEQPDSCSGTAGPSAISLDGWRGATIAGKAIKLLFRIARKKIVIEESGFTAKEELNPTEDYCYRKIIRFSYVNEKVGEQKITAKRKIISFKFPFG